MPSREGQEGEAVRMLQLSNLEDQTFCIFSLLPFGPTHMLSIMLLVKCMGSVFKGSPYVQSLTFPLSHLRQPIVRGSNLLLYKFRGHGS